MLNLAEMSKLDGTKDLPMRTASHTRDASR